MRWFLVLVAIFYGNDVCLGDTVTNNCTTLPFIEHGTLKRLSQTQVKVECEPSYRFHSAKKPSNMSPVIKCLKRGWSEPNPQCVLKLNHCLPPSSPKNGKILQAPPYPVDTNIHYMCDNGYILKGPSERTCQDYLLDWSGRDPVCVEYDPTVIGNVAQYLDEQFVDKMERYASADLARAIEYNVEFLGLDLILLFDKSSSILGEDFKEGIEFAKFLVDRFNVSNGSKDKEGGTRLAVYTFGNTPVPEITWDDTKISTTAKAKQKLDTIKCGLMCDGGTNMVDALAMIDRLFTKNAYRQKAKKALFITSDGVPTAGSTQKPIEFYTNKMKEAGVEIFTVGIGKDVDTNLLKTLANEPPEDHFFELKEFKDFGEVVKIIREKQPPPPPPSIEECGFRSKTGLKNRINGTGEVKPGAWPWLAAVIKVNSSTSDVAFGCNGVLVCNQWVVTPARCLYNGDQVMEPQNFYVILGEDDLSEDSGHEQYFYASKIIIYPEFDIKKFNDKDIALIKLNTEAVLGDYVRTGCIPNEKERHFHAETDSEGVTTGWLTVSEDSKRLSYGGISSVKASQTTLTIHGLDNCDTMKPRKGFNCKDLFNAGNTGLLDKACTGESGSPFHRSNSKGQDIALGLSIYSMGCSLDSKLMIYVPLATYEDWINTETNSCTQDHRPPHPK